MHEPLITIRILNYTEATENTVATIKYEITIKRSDGESRTGGYAQVGEEIGII